MISSKTCAYSVALILAAAAAQSLAAAGKDDILEEVTITAQKRSENLQDVPLSVTAISGEQLETRGIEGLSNLNALAPNVMFRGNPSSKLISTVGIRGSVTGQPAIWVDPSVGLYLNGIYLGKAQGSVFDVVDLERVEVLRGPQGTLFGRNTEGGAVNMVTRKPSGEYGGKATVEFGNYSRKVVRLMLDLPKVGIASASLGYRKEKADGWAKNLTGPDLGAVDSDAARVVVDLDFTDNFKAEYSFDFSQANNTPTPSSLYAVSGWGGTFPSIFGAFLGGAIETAATPYVRTTRPDTVSTNTPAGAELYERNRSAAHSITLDYELNDNNQLKYIFAKRDNHYADSQDIDGMPLASITLFPGFSWGMNAFFSRDTQYSQKSHELQWVGSANKFKWVVGLYHFTDDGFTHGEQAFTLFGSPYQGVDYAAATKAKAVFGQVDYAFTDRLTGTVGMRYTKEHRDGFSHRYNAASYGGPLTTDTVPGTLAPLSYGADFSGNSPMGSLAFKVNDDINVYARVAKGFKSGGFSSELVSPTVATQPYQPQTSLSKEIGLKSTWLDGKARVNIAYFNNKVSNLQITQLVPSTSQSIIVNAGEATYQGVELEAAVVITDGWHLQANFGWLDTKFDKYLDNSFGPGRPIVDSASNRLAPYAPKTTMNVNLDGRLFSSNLGNLRLIVDYSYTGKVNLYAVNKTLDAPNAAGAYVVGTDTVPALTMVNARLLLSDMKLGNGTGEVSLLVRNATNEKQRTQMIDFSMFRGANWQDPRTYGVSFGYKW